jgi:hypothetical protein
MPLPNSKTGDHETEGICFQYVEILKPTAANNKQVK